MTAHDAISNIDQLKFFLFTSYKNHASPFIFTSFVISQSVERPVYQVYVKFIVTFTPEMPLKSVRTETTRLNADQTGVITENQTRRVVAWTYIPTP